MFKLSMFLTEAYEVSYSSPLKVFSAAVVF